MNKIQPAMKHLFTLLSCAATMSAAAQCVWNSDLVTPTVNVFWVDGDLRADGGSMVLAAPGDGLDDILVLRTAPDGSVTWDKRFATTDAGAQLLPRTVLATPDGGAVVLGVRRVPASHVNLFVIKLDASGVKEWARIYMAPESEWMYPEGDLSPRLALHPSGGYVLSMPGHYGVYVNRLDAQGLPLWTRRYEPDAPGPSNRYLMLDLIVEPDDEMMLGLVFNNGGGADLMLLHLLPNGDLDWRTRYDIYPDSEGSMMRAANGDYVFVGLGSSTDVMRVTASGAVSWHKYYGGYAFTGIPMELSSGDIIAVGATNYYLADAMRWQSDGTLVGSWQTNSGVGTPQGLVGIRSDSLFFGWAGLDPLYSDHVEPRLLMAPSVAGMSCAFTSNTVNMTDPGAPTVITTDVVNVFTDVIKIWDLSLGDAIELTQMDLQVYMNTGPARPGFQHQIYAHLNNHLGAPTGPIDATMTVDPQLSIVSATPFPSSVVGNTLTWNNLPSLDGFNPNWNAVQVTTFIPSTVPVGTVITHTMTVVPDSVDIDPGNNSISIDRTVTNSYDPNDKLVWPANTYDLTTDTILDYTIRFQNTGTDTAFTVVVRDTLPNEISVGSFLQGAASHPYTFNLTAEGVATWTFNNILLPDSNTNEPLSHGLVSFRIKPDAGLLPGTVISNTANIYFDFNPPIMTPTASVVLTMPTEVPILHANELLMYPVPVRDVLTVELPGGFVPDQMRVTTLDGREVSAMPLRNATGRVAFPTHELSPGIYLMTVQGRQGELATARFVKE